MTVAGKGGRPRKWTSQADRQRAWRARQTGAAEPATFVEALDNGDELAAAVAHGDALAKELEAAKDKAKAVQTELNRERRERGVEDRRWGWISTLNERLTAENLRMRTELDDAARERRHLERRIHTLETTTGPVAPTPPQPTPPAPTGTPQGRAERRRQERGQRRRNP